MSIDAELLRRYAGERSESAFAELVRRHLNLVYFAALRQVSGDAHLANDIAQSVFTDLARKARSLAERETIASWLHTSTRFAAAKARRAAARRARHEHEAELMHQLERAPAPPADWAQLQPLIDDVVHELGERDRGMVLLRFFENRPFAEIAAAHGMTEDAARMRIARALDRLQTLLARRGVTSTAGALAVALTQQAALAAPAGLAASVAGSALAGGSFSAPAATFLSFMSTSKMAAGVATLVLIVALGGTLHELRANRAGEQARADAMRENDALAAKLRELERQAETERAAATALLSRPATPSSAPTTQVDATAEGNALMARHPEVKRAVLDAVRADFRSGHAALFRALGLGPAEIEQCIDLLSQGSVRAADGPDGRIRFKLDGDRAEAERRLRDLLGEEGFRRYQDSLGLLGEQPPLTMAAEAARALYGTETPLTAEQANRLHEVFIAAEVKGERSRREYDWDRIEAEARTFLSEAQLAPLGLFRAPAQYRQFLDRVRRAATPAGPSIK